MSGYNIVELVHEAQFRWLKPEEVLFILQNYEETQLNLEPPQQPQSGSLFLHRRDLLFSRKDGHNWRRKKDGRILEAHKRLKVGDIEALNCNHANDEEYPTFQRCRYWMLKPAMEHIVLFHYRDTTIVAEDIYIPLPSFKDIGHGEMSSYIHDGNSSNELGDASGRKAPSISYVARANMSLESTHSYSYKESAPSWNALNKRNLSSMIRESENVQEIPPDEFNWNILFGRDGDK